MILITKFACLKLFHIDWSQTVSVGWGWGVWGGIFTVEMLTFSGKSAEKVMGVNGFDCPAIFLGAGALNF